MSTDGDGDLTTERESWGWSGGGMGQRVAVVTFDGDESDRQRKKGNGKHGQGGGVVLASRHGYRHRETRRELKGGSYLCTNGPGIVAMCGYGSERISTRPENRQDLPRR